jgi:hypothetical protein
MVRLRQAVMAVALGTTVMGCTFSHSNVAHYSIWHCDECDDFPAPAYGPGNSMMPGTYTGQPPRDRPETTKPADTGADRGPVAPSQPPAASLPPATSTPPAVTTPPLMPSASPPGLGAANRLPDRPTGLLSAVATSADATLPPLPPTSQDAVPSPAAHP